MIKNAQCKNQYRIIVFTFAYLFGDFIDPVKKTVDWKRCTPEVVSDILSVANIDIDLSAMPLNL